MMAKDGRLNVSLVSLIILVILIAIVLFSMSINRVDAGYVGVITRWGAVNRVVYPGISWKIPVAEGIRMMDVRTQKDQVDATAASKNLQTVTSTIAVNYHLDGQYAAAVYQSVGMNYKDILIAPAVQNIFKQATANFTAEELITKRESVRVLAEQELSKQLAI